VAIPGALLLGLLAFITHKLVVPSFHVGQVTGREATVGMESEVMKTLKLTGVIRLEGENWAAKSVEGDILASQVVEIESINKLVLEVRRKGW
jgi:membrane-bound ClpP family serine protease